MAICAQTSSREVLEPWSPPERDSSQVFKTDCRQLSKVGTICTRPSHPGCSATMIYHTSVGYRSDRQRPERSV